MTSLLITPNTDRKTARFSGTVAAGEHVAVTINGGASWSSEGLTLRVIDLTTKRTLAVFPRPEEALGENEEPDAWGTSGANLTCTLNLNTAQMVNAARHMLRVPVLFVLGDSGDDARTLYFRDKHIVEFWPERIGDDTPYDLDTWPKQIDEWKDQIEAWDAQMQNFATAISDEAHAREVGDLPLSGQTINTNTTNAMRQAIKTIGAALGATMRVVAVCAALPLFGATVKKVSFGDLDLDTDPQVVTNVTFEGLLTEHQDISGKADKTNVYTKAQTEAKIVELAPAPGNYETVSNRAMSALQSHQDISGKADTTNTYTKSETDARIVELSPPAPPETDPYFSAFTNNGGRLLGPLRISQDEDFDYVDTVLTSNGVSAWRWLPGPGGSGGSYINYRYNWWDLLTSESDPHTPAWARSETKPSYTADEVGAAPASHATNKNNPHNVTIQQIGAFSASDGSTVMGIVNTWEGYWDGTNVVFEVTNYYGNSSGELPRLRIKEFRDGTWNIVWDEITKYEVCESNILYKVSESNRVLKIELKRDFAPIAWGTVTDKGSPNVVSNSVWMTSPETYFAGGTEYQRVAVGSGTICVLVDNGAGTYTAGEEGTFRFQDEGGTNYFGFAKSDSYTIGCKTDGISVEGTLVTLRYDVIMGGSDTPIVYYRQTLSAGEWVQLNNSDGTAASGAPYTVTWYTSGGSYYAAINCGDNASGFFKAETSVAGDVVFETNMKARLGGGIECLNTANGTIGVIRPTFNGSTVSWSWSAR